MADQVFIRTSIMIPPLQRPSNARMMMIGMWFAKYEK
jgi:hypothetical protein